MAEIVRSGFVEGHHYGSVVALARDGAVAGRWATVEPRSSRAPATSRSRRSGWSGAASTCRATCSRCAGAFHSGEDFHVEGVRRILASAGLDEELLQTPARLPAGRRGPRVSSIRAGSTRRST